jgi:ubiquinone/menaquinone biosynthesis C-methylase UbiE
MDEPSRTATDNDDESSAVAPEASGVHQGALDIVVEGYDAVYAAISNSATFSRIWGQHALGDDYPTDFAHISFLILDELRAIRQRLALREGAVLVDLACGAAGPGLWVAKAAGVTLVGVDPSAVGLTHARARAGSVGVANTARFTHGTFAATGLANAAADGAMSVDALQYAPDKRAGLQEAARILRPGGRFVFTAFEVAPQRVEGLPVLGVDPVADYGPLLEEAGFAVESYEETGGWAERVHATFKAVVEAMPVLMSEMGAPAASALGLEAALTLQYRPYRRRVLVVARAPNGCADDSD